jgi:hypothetical protein
MTELAGLNVKINGDAGNLRAELQSAEDGLQNLSTEAKKASTQLGAAGNRAKTYGTQVKSATAHTGNLAAQFNDIGMMLAAGQSPLMLAVQQGSQINQVLGQMGTTGASRLAALGAAFKSVVSPANLATFAIIAGGAALVQWAVNSFSAKSETDNFRMSLDEARESVAEMAEELRLLQLGRTPEEDAYVRAVELAKQGVIEQQAEVDELNKLIEAGAVGMQASLVEAERILAQRKANLAAAEAELQAARRLPLELGKSKEEMSELEREAADTRMAFEAYDEALRIALGEAIKLQFTTKSTADDADRFLASMQKAGQIDPSMRVAGGDDPGRKGTGTNEPAKTGAATVDPLAAELAALQESLMTQEELQIASFQRQQETLEQALSQKLLTQQEYNALMQDAQAQHADAMAQIDAYRYGSTLDKTGAFLGDMASALAKGNDQMLQASKAFAAAEALVNAWRAYSQALADPTIPTLGKIAAAASVLSAGIGAVNAITSVGSSGTGATTAGASTAATTTAAAPATSSNVAIQLTGGDMFSRDQVVDLINAINEAVEDGATVRLV